MRVMFRPELAQPLDHPSLDEAAGHAMELLVVCVAECQRAGTMPAGDPTPIVLTGWAAAHGLASLAIDGPLLRMYPSVPGAALAAEVARTLGSLLAAARAGR
jgi:hypothetical protein